MFYDVKYVRVFRVSKRFQGISRYTPWRLPQGLLHPNSAQWCVRQHVDRLQHLSLCHRTPPQKPSYFNFKCFPPDDGRKCLKRGGWFFVHDVVSYVHHVCLKFVFIMTSSTSHHVYRRVPCYRLFAWCFRLSAYHRGKHHGDHFFYICDIEIREAEENPLFIRTKLHPYDRLSSAPCRVEAPTKSLA